MKTLFLACVLTTLLGSATAQQTVGLFTKQSGQQDGYVLFAPTLSDSTYLIDKCGKRIHTWHSAQTPGQSVYLLPDGSLLRTGFAGNTLFPAGGKGGLVERLDWNSNVIWSYLISDDTQCQHHDVCVLPDGNILAIVWEKKTGAEAITAGRNPDNVSASLWGEKIVELQPLGDDSAIVVWEWHVWDHIVQQFDSTQNNFGVVSENPQLVNINFPVTPGFNPDWLHFNSIDYNAELDQIMVSVHNTNEIWIIDHSTTTAEAASHIGGLRGRGGDLLYRWGNPVAYNRGLSDDKKFFGQHNANWISNGLVDAGKIMVFNNGLNRPQGAFSSVEILAPPVDANGNYMVPTGTTPFLPAAAEWIYTAPVPTDFYAGNISGAQRLPGGNTIICTGPKGEFFEIDANKSTVWRYVNPVGNNITIQGNNPQQNTVFRCTWYPTIYSGLANHVLSPGLPLEFDPLPYECNMLVNTTVSPVQAEGIWRCINPFREKIEILSPVDMDNAVVVLTDDSGTVLQTWCNISFRSREAKQLPVEEFSDGVYFLRIAGAHQNLTLKIVSIR